MRRSNERRRRGSGFFFFYTFFVPTYTYEWWSFTIDRKVQSRCQRFLWLNFRFLTRRFFGHFVNFTWNVRFFRRWFTMNNTSSGALNERYTRRRSFWSNEIIIIWTSEFGRRRCDLSSWTFPKIIFTLNGSKKLRFLPKKFLWILLLSVSDLFVFFGVRRQNDSVVSGFFLRLIQPTINVPKRFF